MNHKTIIIGSGPAGLSAALYLARAQLKPILFAGSQSGGQLMFTREVENFPGFSQGIMGPKLMMELRAQAEKFGTQIIDADISKVDLKTKPFTLWQGEEKYEAQVVLIATGAEAITLGLPQEKEFLGRGISTCAVCDAAFFGEKIVYVVGGGDSACEDGLALTKFASQVFIIVRRDELRASKIMQQRVLNHDKIKILYNTEVKAFSGKTKIEGLTLLNNKDQKEEKVTADGLFYAIGHKPLSSLFNNQIDTDDQGYILTGLNGLTKTSDSHQLWQNSYPTMTSVKGVFGAGDVVDFRYRQAVVAAGMGTMAALDIEKYLEKN